MKILLSCLWKMVMHQVDRKPYTATLEHHDEHVSLGAYSILCSLERKADNKHSH